MQLPLFLPDVKWTPPDLNELPDWSSFERIGADTETKDPEIKTLGPGVRRKGNHLAGVSLAFEHGPAFYLPIAHEGGDNCDKDKVLEYLRYNAKRYKGTIVGANLSYDIDWFLENGIEFPEVKHFRDVQIADPLINELHDRYSLAAICERHNVPGKDEALLKQIAKDHGLDPKKDLWRLPARYVAQYAIQDAVSPLLALRKQERIIDEQDLWRIYDLESQVLPVLVRMRRRGVRVDFKRLAKIEQWSLEQEAEALAFVKRETGCQIKVGDVWKADALAPAIIHLGVELACTYTKKGKAKYSIDKDLLASLKHPVAEKLAWARKVNKLRTTFAESVRRYAVDDRIHCTFNQLRRTKDDDADGAEGLEGAAYGRLSCVDPNMQQQPSRDEFAAEWRSIYIPDEGGIWCSNDYSQQEPRMLVHFAEECNLPRADIAAQKYREDPNTDNHQMMADMAGIARKPAKELFLGKCYGMGGAKLARKLGLPTRYAVFGGWSFETEYFENYHEASDRAREVEKGRAFEVAGVEAQAIIDRFDSELPFIKELAKLTKKKADKVGFIKTIGGRHCHFPEGPDGGWDWTHKSLNRLIQGSSADQTKTAMIMCDAEGHPLQLQVHDEMGGTVSDISQAKRIAEIMCNCITLRIPSKVDIEVGPSWGEAKGI